MMYQDIKSHHIMIGVNGHDYCITVIMGPAYLEDITPPQNITPRALPSLATREYAQCEDLGLEDTIT